MRDRKLQQRITIFLGILLSFGMVATMLVPLLPQNMFQPETQPTSTPRPTQLPTPDITTINFDSTYLHPSGLFTVAIPSTYILTNEFNSTGEAQVTMENTAAQSVLEMRVLRPTDQISLDSPEGLGELFTSSWLGSSWNRYSSWDEDARRVEDDKLVIDFTLTRGGQNYVARQVAFTDGTWVYMIRVVSPSNAAEAMQHVLDGEVESFQIIDRFVGSQLEWDGYFDDASNHLLRFPGEWTVVDGAEGVPASVIGPGAQLRLETTDTTIDSADAASQFVAGLRSNISVLSVEPVEQYGNSGFRVAYTQSTVDGDSESGAVLLLNDGDITHVLNLLLTDVADTDLNAVDLEVESTPQNLKDAREVLDTFSLFPDLEVDNS